LALLHGRLLPQRVVAATHYLLLLRHGASLHEELAIA
jgi:hypothetical protein